MRDKIRLVSSAGTGYFYTTTKNKRTMPEKMEIKKFDPKIRQHVIFKEAKKNYFFFSKHDSAWGRFFLLVFYKKLHILAFFLLSLFISKGFYLCHMMLILLFYSL